MSALKADGSELSLMPAAFVAVTVNVYAVSWVSPVAVTEVPVVVAVTPSGSEVTVYSVIGLPPSEAGAVHETTTRMSPGVADTVAIIKLVTNSVGAPGTRAGVTEFDASEDRLVPLEFVAVTVKVYAVPLVRPVTVSEVAVVVAVIPPRDEMTVYSVTVLPPSEADAVHETVARRFPGIADTLVGELGTVVATTEVPSVVEVTWVPALPAVSAKLIVKATAPSVSPDARVNAAVHSFPLALVTVTNPVAEAPPIEKATVGEAIVSFAVNERVTVSPTFATLVALPESIDTLVSVGAVLSNVTEEESVVEVTWVPALLDMSLKSIVNATAPSVSPEAKSKVAVQ